MIVLIILAVIFLLGIFAWAMVAGAEAIQREERSAEVRIAAFEDVANRGY